MSRCPVCKTDCGIAWRGEMPCPCPACRTRFVGPYCDLERVGGGGMGDVYRARRPDMGDRPVAIKIPKTATDQLRLRFEREIAAAARLQHENIVRIFDRGEAAGVPFLVMEFVVGRSLRQVIDAERPVPWSRAARILRGVAAGLAHAGERGIVNRDIKPDNILLSVDEVPKILDYGLALLREATDADQFVTREGVLLGTTAYLAPEQAVDPHTVTIRADVYALGCTAFHLLTGRAPFHGDVGELCRLHATAPRPSVRADRPDVPPEFDALIQRMMAAKPADRPEPAEVVAELGRLISTLSPSPPVAGPGLATSPPPEPTTSLPEVFVGAILDDDVPEVQQPHAAAVPAAGLRPLEPLAESPPPIVVGTVIDEDAPPARPGLTPASQRLQDSRSPEPVVVGQMLDDQPPAAPTVAAAADSTGGAAFRPRLQAIERTPRGEPEVATLPISAIVDEQPARQPASPRSQPAPASGPPRLRPRRSSRRRWAVALAGAALVMAAAYGTRQVFLRPPDPDQVWSNIQQEDYQLHKWQPAEDRLRQFAVDYPDHPRASEVPFFLAMCDAGREVFSETGDPQKGLAKVEKNFLDYRDRNEYDLYCSDLYMSLVRLIERLVKRSEKTADPQDLAAAQRACELLKTVAQAMSEDWVPQRTQGLEEQLVQARLTLERALARKEVLRLAAAITDRATPVAELDPAYEQIRRVLARIPALANEAELRKVIAEAYQSESGRVEYLPVEDTGPAVTPLSPRDVDLAFIVWDDGAAPPENSGDDDVFLAIARGVLYAFAADGRYLWARRLGFDSDRPPVAIRPSPTSPEALIAVSTLDNTLLALDERSGQVLWEYQAGGQQDLAAPLTISRWRPQPNQPEIVRGLLPTASGEIHVLELARGKRIGCFRTGFPMTVGGTYDPQTRLAYFPAERQRVFAIDPAIIELQLRRTAAAGGAGGLSSDAGGLSGGAGGGSDGAPPSSADSGGDTSPLPARSVLFTGHPAGSLRSEPVVVGQYLILTEAADLDHTKVRAFQLQSPQGFLNPRAEALSELTLRGWSWFAPPATPDRITVVTDEGDLGVCGVNLDNRSEALYLLIQSAADKCPSLAIREPSRALGIHSNEHLLWLMAGGTLQHLALDVLNQKVIPLWPTDAQPAPVSGIPLHEASMDRTGTRIYVTTKSLQGHQITFSAVDAARGQRLWQRHLGVSPVGDLIPTGDALELVDRTGRLLHIAAVADGQGERLQITQDRAAPEGADGGELLRLQDAGGGTFLVAVQDQGTKLALRRFPSGAGAAWQEIQLPGIRLQGRPAVAGAYLVVPGSDGRLHRLRWDGTGDAAVNELPFAWKSSVTLAPTDSAAVYALGDDQLLLIDGPRARCLKFGEQAGIKQWQQQGGEFLAPAPLSGEPVVLADYLFLADVRGVFHRVSRSRPESESPRWPLPGKVTAEPLVFNGSLLTVQDYRRVVFLSIAGSPPELRLVWTSDEFGGRICGRPVPLSGYFMVTDESGEVTVLNAADGRRARGLTLPPGTTPAAAAAPLGRGRVLIPLADGTLLWQQVARAASQPVAEAE